jgi:transcriptional regulator with XRE-family HTH domain
MEKSLFSKNYELLLTHLRDSRTKAGLTQEQVASRLHQTQSFVSKCERGERRIDLVELREFCRALGIPFTKFVKELDDVLEAKTKQH